MPLHSGRGDLAIRSILTLASGTLIRLNREEGGHLAGLRTNMLVCLAASVSMIQAKLWFGPADYRFGAQRRRAARWRRSGFTWKGWNNFGRMVRGRCAGR